MNTETKPRVALFARVSTDDQAAEGKKSIEGQLDACREYAERKSWTVVEEFKEEGVSGGTSLMRRPEVLRMLSMAAAGDLDNVVFNERDRVARDTREARNLYEELQELNVALHTVEGGERDYDENLLPEVLFDAISEEERRKTAKRTTRGRHRRAKAGHWVGGGSPPYGYRKDAEGRLVIDDGAAEVVRFAYKRAVAGDSLSEVTRRLNSEFPKFDGQRGATGFTPGTVQRWITKPGYKGADFVQRVKPAPKASHEDIPTPAPAIVTPEIWADANANLAASRAAWRSTFNRPVDGRVRNAYALSGSIFHEHEKSGPVLLFGVSPNGNRRYRCSHTTKRYKDQWQGRDEFDPCGGWGVNPQNKGMRRTALNAPEMEARLMLRLVEAFRSPEALAELRTSEDRRIVAAGETEETLDAARREGKGLVVERERTMKRQGRMTDAEFDSWFGDWEDRRRENEGIVARLENEAENLSGYAVTLDELLAMTVGYLGVSPDDSSEYEIDQRTGDESITTLGWADLMDRIALDADGVLSGERKELPAETIAWLADMVARFRVRVVVEHGEGSEFSYRFDADRGLVFEDETESPTLKS